MSNYLRTINNNLNHFKKYTDTLNEYNTRIVFADEIVINNTNQTLYTVTNDIENITIDISLDVVDSNLLEDSQVRLPCGYNDDKGHNFSIHLGKNILSLSETLTKDDNIQLYFYSRTDNHPVITAKVTITSTIISE